MSAEAEAGGTQGFGMPGCGAGLLSRMNGISFGMRMCVWMSITGCEEARRPSAAGAFLLLVFSAGALRRFAVAGLFFFAVFTDLRAMSRRPHLRGGCFVGRLPRRLDQ